MSEPERSRRRYAVVGAGALGGLYGAMLARAGHAVQFLLRSDYEASRQRPWKVESHWGDFSIDRIDAVDSADKLLPADVTILSTKTVHNDSADGLLKKVTAGGGRVMVLQNGLDIEGPAIRTVGRSRVLSGVCFLCSNKVGPCHIRHLDQGRVMFGRLDGPCDATVEGIAEDFREAGIPTKTTDDVAAMRWRKLMWNIPFNGLSVAVDASTRELIDDPHSRSLAESLIDEVHAAAAACGVMIPEKQKTQTIQATLDMVPYDSSMRVDFRERRPLEIEAIFENPIRAAAEHGLAMSRTGTLAKQLRFLDRRNRQNG